jgi:hypothetical protein
MADKKKPEREVVILHPAHERFIEFLVDTAIKDIIRRQREGLPEPVSSPPWPELSEDPDRNAPEFVTIDEAVKRLGLTREEIMAQFEREPPIPFEVEIPATRSARDRPPRRTRKKPNK